MEPTHEVSISIQHLSKNFMQRHGQVTAIEDLSIDVKDGEFLCIVGPSGCGKTTLLRILAGLEQQSEGRILIKRKMPKTPLTAMVFQSDSVFPWMTVEQNVGYGLLMQKVPSDIRQERVQHFLEMTGLLRFRKSYPYQLSGGMKQRVNVARAFAADPEILLMDEPFGLLDEQNRLILQRELMHIWAESRKTTIFITHSVDEALVLGDRVLVMTKSPGRVREIVDIDIDRPRDIISLRGDPRFIKFHRQVWELLSQEVLLSKKDVV